MTVHPNPKPETVFSDAITFRFRMRPLTIPDAGIRRRTEAEEITFDVTFDPPGPGGGSAPVQMGRCGDAG
jgi:hypothetical protein